MQRQICKRRQRHLALLMGIALIPFALAACFTASKPVTITATPAVVAGLPAARLNPFTGLPADPALFARRPMAVKISNAPDSVRPQAGLGSAALVFEHYVEGGLTRFTALFWSSVPARVGSIRSARLIDLELVAMYDALFVYSGASEPIRQRIAALPIAPRAYEGTRVGEPLYYRDPSLPMPHNLFAVPAAVWARAAAENLDKPGEFDGGLVFDPRPPADAPAVRQITIDYGPDEVRWTYDPDTRRYTRSSDGEIHRDALTDEPITAANVVVIYAHHQPDYTIVESEWQGVKSYSIEIQIWTLGPVMVFRDGRRQAGYWQRWEEEDPLALTTDQAGELPLALKPGNTWFEVVPLDFTTVIVE